MLVFSRICFDSNKVCCVVFLCSVPFHFLKKSFFTKHLNDLFSYLLIKQPTFMWHFDKKRFPKREADYEPKLNYGWP